MSAASYDLAIEQGADFPLRITWEDAAGVPINLTGYRIRLQFRAQLTDTVKLLDFDSSALSAGMTIGTLNSTGIIAINLSSAITSAFTFTKAAYDLTATSAGGTVTRLIEGAARLDKAVTR